MAEEIRTILGGAGEGETQDPPPVKTEEVVTPVAPVAPASTLTFDKVVSADGALADNWRDLLPENLRGEKSLDNIKNFSTLAQSYVHGQKAIGANKVALPGEHATKEELDAYYNATGRPETPEKYEFKGALPEGFTLDKAELGEFKKYAHERGFSQADYQSALEFDLIRAQKADERAIADWNAEFERSEAELKQQYGANYDSVIAQCNKALDTFGLTEIMAGNRLLNNAGFIRAMADVGAKISESRLKGGDPVVVADPASRLNEINSNPDDPYHKADHPAHKARVEEVGRLLEAVAKGKK